MDSQHICHKWKYGSQMDDKNKPYSVGGAKWDAIIATCKPSSDFDHNEIFLACERGEDLHTQKTPEAVKKAKNILDLLLIQSSFVNAYGMIEHTYKAFQDGTITDLPRSYMNVIYEYLEFYQLIREILYDNALKLFTTPEEFGSLAKPTSSRPKNIMFSTSMTTQQIIDKYQIKKIDNIQVNSRFKKMFADVQEPYKHFAGICSAMTRKITPSNSDLSTFGDMGNLNIISNGDIKLIQAKHTIASINDTKKPPIIIQRVPNTYLSQLFEKTCTIFYKPFVMPAKSDKESDIMEAAEINEKIIRHGCRGYFNGNMSVFQTNVCEKTHTNVPVFFFYPENSKLTFDFGNSQPAAMIKQILKEFVDLKVFIPISDTDVYELNRNFDITTLECCKNVPASLKADVEEYFFLFVGNIIHFAVANNIKLPFKMSLAYVINFFNLEYDKELLICSYLIERVASSRIIKILENPENLKDPVAIAFLDKDLKGSARAKGVRMRNYTKHVYDKDPETVKNNIMEYLHELAEITDIRVLAMFEGFKYCKLFKKPSLFKMNTLDTDTYTNEQKLNIIAKVNYYISK